MQHYRGQFVLLLIPYGLSAHQETTQRGKSKKYMNIVLVCNQEWRKYYIPDSISKYFTGRGPQRRILRAYFSFLNIGVWCHLRCPVLLRPLPRANGYKAMFKGDACPSERNILGHPGKCLDGLSNPGTYSHNQFERIESSYYRTTPDKRNLICKRIKLILMIREARGFSKTIVEIVVLNTVKRQ